MHPVDPNRPMRIRLDEERNAHLIEAIQKYFAEEFDEDISAFRAERILAFFVKEIGAPVYNQAIRDAQKFVQDKLTDLDGEFYEPEAPMREVP